MNCNPYTNPSCKWDWNSVKKIVKSQQEKQINILMQNETNSLFIPVYEHSRTCKKRENLLESLLFWGFLFPGVYLGHSPQTMSSLVNTCNSTKIPSQQTTEQHLTLKQTTNLSWSNYFGWFRKWFCQIMLKDQLIFHCIVFKWLHIHFVTLRIGRNNYFSSSKRSKNNYPQIVSACC